MAKNSSGTHNQPVFEEEGQTEIGGDLTLVSEYAALVGNRKIGTTGERLSIFGNQRWEGLGFYDTSLEYPYVWDGAAWAGEPVYIADASPYFTMASGWAHEGSTVEIQGAVVTFRFLVQRTGSAISALASGNITNELILTLTDTTLRPLNTIALCNDSRSFKSAFCLLADGTCYISALPPGIPCGTGEHISFSGTYLRNVLG